MFSAASDVMYVAVLINFEEILSTTTLLAQLRRLATMDPTFREDQILEIGKIFGKTPNGL